MTLTEARIREIAATLARIEAAQASVIRPGLTGNWPEGE